MERKTRGQSAIEYLSNYGFAITIIVLAGVVLWQMNVFNPAALFSSKYCGGFSQVHCSDFALDATGNIVFVFENSASQISDITLVDDQERQIPGSACENSFDLQNSAKPGESFKCTSPGGSIITGAVFGTIVSDQRIQVRYRTDASGIYHVDTGSIKGSTG
jgi:hypothetical protein